MDGEHWCLDSPPKAEARGSNPLRCAIFFFSNQDDRCAALGRHVPWHAACGDAVLRRYDDGKATVGAARQKRCGARSASLVFCGGIW